MEHLISEFNEAIKDVANCYIENGLVCIGGKYWEPTDILKQFSETTYKEVFDNWLSDRQEYLLQIADEFLAEFNQQERFNKLKQCFSSNTVIPFVGAGLSNPSGYPMWTSFLKKLVIHTKISPETLDRKLDAGEYEEIAQELADQLGPIFSEQIENTFGDKKEIKGVVQLLPYLFNCPVITTNYDSLLKRCYDAKNIHFDEVISGHQASEITRFLAAGQRVLIKLHGTALSGKGRVLTLNEYKEHYEQNTVLESVIAAVCRKTILFLGCSLSIDRTIKAMELYAESSGHDNVPRHYAFLKDPELQSLRNEKSRMLGKANIYPIWYSGGDHDQAIEALLQKLGSK